MGRPGEYAAAVSLRAWAEEAEAAAGIAKALAGTPFVPEQLRRYTNPNAKPEQRQLDYDGTVATVTAVLLAGQELGFGPMASLRSITIIKGTVGLYALAARALLLQRGHEIIVKESTSQRAVVIGRRAGGEWQTSTWDLDRARTAKLFPGTEYSNWRTQTKAMLVARATAEASRWVAADAMLGLPVMAEELEENVDGVVPALEVGSAATVQPAAEVSAAKPATTKRKTPAARVALPAATMPPAPEPAPPAAPVPQEPQRVEPRLTAKARTRILASLRDLGFTSREEVLGLLSAWLGRAVASTNDLTPEEAITAIERLDALLKLGAHQNGDHSADPAAEAADPAEPPEEPPDAEPD
jgi:hypothetical protein